MDGPGYFNDLSESSDDENEVEEAENEHQDFSHIEFNSVGG